MLLAFHHRAQGHSVFAVCFHCVVLDWQRCVLLLLHKPLTDPKKHLSCLGEGNCSQGSPNLCWVSKKPKQGWCNDGSDGGWGRSKRMQLLQSGMKERGDTMAKVVITYTQTVAQPKNALCCTCCIYAFVCRKKLRCLQFSLSFSLTLFKHSSVLCSLTWPLSKGKENPDCWNRGATSNRLARL